MWPFTETDESKKPKIACETQRQVLLNCLLMTPCVNRDGKRPKECIKLRNEPGIEECRVYLKEFIDCKHELIDMRTRFRGRKGMDYDKYHKVKSLEPE